jgi:formate dehydrogenase subunit gamma
MKDEHFGRTVRRRARRRVGAHGRTVVRRGELLRHPVYTRVLHWTVAIFFVLSLLSGFALYTPVALSRAHAALRRRADDALAAPVVQPRLRGRLLLSVPQLARADGVDAGRRRWMRRIKEYVTNEEKLEPEDVGFFNGGQKLYFWAIVASALLFLVTGLPMWFDDAVPRWLVALSYVVHDVAALVMLGGFIIHVYEGTAAQPGTFQAMTDGTVSEEWAWTHHPAWYADGRDPRADWTQVSRSAEYRTPVVQMKDRCRPRLELPSNRNRWGGASLS